MMNFFKKMMVFSGLLGSLGPLGPWVHPEPILWYLVDDKVNLIDLFLVHMFFNEQKEYENMENVKLLKTKKIDKTDYRELSAFLN